MKQTAKQDFLQVHGGRLYYEVVGEGHPLLLIHAGIANLRMWDLQVPAFAEHYRVIRYDTRGFGKTTTEEVPFSNRQDLVELFRHLDVSSAYVLGCSRGGQIAIDFTLGHPARVDALIAVDAGLSGFQPTRPPELQALWKEMESLWEAKDWVRLSEVETALWVDGPGQAPDRVDPAMRERVRGWIQTNYQTQTVEGKPQRLEPPAAGRLAEIRVPTLVIYGDLDEPGPIQAGGRLAAEIPGARKHVMHGVAHLPNLERPEEFTRIVLGFLESAS